MEHTSLVNLKRHFREIVDVRAPATISEEGAKRSAGIIVEIENKYLKNKGLPIDIFSVVVSTSQLLQYFDQENKEVLMGYKSKPGNPKRQAKILEQLLNGISDQKNINNLKQELYVVDPELGATRAMELLIKLHEKYPHISIK